MDVFYYRNKHNLPLESQLFGNIPFVFHVDAVIPVSSRQGHQGLGAKLKPQIKSITRFKNIITV